MCFFRAKKNADSPEKTKAHCALHFRERHKEPFCVSTPVRRSAEQCGVLLFLDNGSDDLIEAEDEYARYEENEPNQEKLHSNAVGGKRKISISVPIDHREYEVIRGNDEKHAGKVRNIVPKRDVLAVLCVPNCGSEACREHSDEADYIENEERKIFVRSADDESCPNDIDDKVISHANMLEIEGLTEHICPASEAFHDRREGSGEQKACEEEEDNRYKNGIDSVRSIVSELLDGVPPAALCVIVISKAEGIK